MSDEKFPARVYKDTVLAPLFEGVKRHHWRYQMRINQASAVLLAECGLLDKRGSTRHPRSARRHPARPSTSTASSTPASTRTSSSTSRASSLADWASKSRASSIPGAAATISTTPCSSSRSRPAGGAARRRTSRMIETLLAVAERERETIVVAYTHGQPAQPTTYGHYLAAFIELSLRDMDRLLHAARTADLSQHGGRGDHHVGLRARSQADGRIAGVRRRAGKLLWLHRRRRLRDGRVCGAQAHLHPRGTLRPGLEHVDRVRDRAPARARRLRPGELDHAAEAQSRAGRASAPDGLARRRPLRGGADRGSQHAVHRHERFRRRSADRRLRGVRHGASIHGSFWAACSTRQRSTAREFAAISTRPASRSPSSPTPWCAPRRSRSARRTTSRASSRAA